MLFLFNLMIRKKIKNCQTKLSAFEKYLLKRAKLALFPIRGTSIFVLASRLQPDVTCVNVSFTMLFCNMHNVFVLVAVAADVAVIAF